MLTRNKSFKLLDRSEVDKTNMGKKSKENGAAEEKSEWVMMVPGKKTCAAHCSM